MRHEWKNAIFLRRQKTATESQRKVFARLFQKAADSKGGAFGRVPQDAKHFFVHKAQERRQTSRWDVWRGRTLAGGSPMRLLPHFFFAPFYSAFATNSHSTKLCNLFFCAPAARAPTFPCVEKWAKDAKEGVFRLPPLLTPPPQRPKGVPPLDFSASPRIALLWGFFNAFLFCIRLQKIIFPLDKNICSVV